MKFNILLIALVGIISPIVAVKAQTDIDPYKKTKKEKKAEKEARINALIKQEEEGAIIFNKQNIYGFKLLTDGWSILYEKGKQKSINKTNLFSIEFGERKHPKEQKNILFSSGGGFIFGTPLIYGKENNFFFLKAGLGQSYLIGGKGNKNGVSVSAIYGGGLSLGLLKPYYVDVADPTTQQIVSVKWEGGDGKYDPSFLFAPQGSSGVFKGAGETKIKPGAFVKGALRFDYGRYNELVSAVETGFNVEFYTANMPIMVENEAKKLFLNLFVAIEFGKRK